MLLNIFRINNHIVYVYLIVFSLCLGIFATNFSAQAAVFSDSALSYIFLPVNFGWLAKTSGVLLLLTNIIVFDLLLTSQEVSEKNNHIPALLLGIFLSYATSQNSLHPLLFAQLLLSISIWRFLSVYKSDRAFSAVFDGAFSLSAAAILYPPYILFLLLGFIGLLSLRSFSLTAVFFLLKIRTISNKIKTQKSFVIFTWMLILSIPAWFLSTTGGAFSGLLSAMPLSVFCGIYLGSAKSRILAELLVWALLILFVLSMLQQASVIN